MSEYAIRKNDQEWNAFYATSIPLNKAAVSQSDMPGPEVIKLFFMLNSGEHEIFPAHKC